MSTDLTALLEAEARRFPLEPAPDPRAPTGIVELETLREPKPLGVGIYVKHLGTGEEAAVRPDVVFESQSVIKLAVAILAYQLADRGELDLDQRVRVTRADIVGGSGILRYCQEGIEPTVRDLLTTMILMSDNTATDLLLARVGGVAGVNSWLAGSGYADTRFVQTVLDSVRLPYLLADERNAALSCAQVFALGSDDPAWAGMSAEWLAELRGQVTALGERPLEEVRALAAARGIPVRFGQMTPREAGRMLESIHSGSATSAAGRAAILAALAEQQLGERRLPGQVDGPVGHKTGDSPPWDANDVGIIDTPSGPIVVAVFANDLAGDYAEQEERIGRIGRVVVDHFTA